MGREQRENLGSAMVVGMERGLFTFPNDQLASSGRGRDLLPVEGLFLMRISPVRSSDGSSTQAACSLLAIFIDASSWEEAVTSNSFILVTPLAGRPLLRIQAFLVNQFRTLGG